MSKKVPELTWQDKAILIVIPLVVFIIFILANYLSRDLTVAEAYEKKMEKVQIRDAGNIIELLPSNIASGTQRCRLQSRDGSVKFIFQYNIQGSDTMNLQIGRLVQFYGEYRYTPEGGIVEAPFKGKSGRITGWVVYENKRFFNHEEERRQSGGEF